MNQEIAAMLSIVFAIISLTLMVIAVLGKAHSDYLYRRDMKLLSESIEKSKNLMERKQQ